MEQMNQNSGKGMVCKCPHHSIKPWILIILGIVVLLGAFNVITWMVGTVAFGVLLIVLGFIKMKSRSCECCDRP